ncbi:MAG: hypothetical protein IKK48_06295 [Firmicutes bacterium]|nr:hypothetical protein [Bacillota bacterium]
MVEEKKRQKPLTEVWGDTVSLRELLVAVLLGIVFTMGFYLVARHFFLQIDSIEDSLAKGYALFVGIAGCLISSVISAKMFKPKRIISEMNEQHDIEEVLAHVGMTVEDEIDALIKLDPEIIKEMENFSLYALLALIPEGAPNYKPEYKILAEGGKVEDVKEEEVEPCH